MATLPAHQMLSLIKLDVRRLLTRKKAGWSIHSFRELYGHAPPEAVWAILQGCQDYGMKKAPLPGQDNEARAWAKIWVQEMMKARIEMALARLRGPRITPASRPIKAGAGAHPKSKGTAGTTSRFSSAEHPVAQLRPAFNLEEARSFLEEQYNKQNKALGRRATREADLADNTAVLAT